MPGFSIDGISSGIDTTSYIDAIMEIERQPALLLEYQQAEKTNIVSAFKSLQAKILALQTSTGLLSRTATFNAASVSISDDSYINATTTGRVGAGSYDMQVLSLARNHQIASQGFDDQSAADMGTGTISLGLGDGSVQTITVDASNNSLVGIKAAINSADVGVTANIINDGSRSNPYRLILTGDKTGIENEITVTSNLTGGFNLNYDTASFDSPEILSFGSGTTSQVALSPTAAFTGDKNKIYTFTVDGTGEQTVGSDIITLNWSDGTNSGSILVTQADNEVELVGDGADGLKLSFASGVFTGGDSFQVSSFSPLLQEASDAKLAVGSNGGTGSPIIVVSNTNQFKDVIAGVSLVLKKETEVGDYVSIQTDVDTAAIRETIQDVISKYNSVMDFIDDQNTYNMDTEESGVLFADWSVQSMQSSIRSAFTGAIRGLDSKYNQLASMGIRSGVNGQLSIKNSSALDKALRENLDEVISLFTDTGMADSTFIEFVSSTSDTIVGSDYDVEITQAATQGRLQGSGIADPGITPLTLTAAHNRLKLSVDGLHSNEIILAEKSYNSTEELVKELQEKIDNDEKIGGRGLTVEWVESGSGMGFLNLTSSTYGSGSKVSLITSVSSSAYASLGLISGVSRDGLDVEGTINGESATGSGQTLTGDEGNATTDGLKIRVTATAEDLIDGVEGKVSVTKGIAARLSNTLDSLTATGEGMLDSRIRSYQNQIENIRKQVEDIDERLEIRRRNLQEQFYAMEAALGVLNATSSYLETQLKSLNANWGTGSSRNN